MSDRVYPQGDEVDFGTNFSVTQTQEYPFARCPWFAYMAKPIYLQMTWVAMTLWTKG